MHEKTLGGTRFLIFWDFLKQFAPNTLENVWRGGEALRFKGFVLVG